MKSEERRIRKSMLIAIFLAVLALASVGYAAADTLTVCSSGCNYTSIQDAINNATAGDTIEVRSGTYYENVNVSRQLILRGNDTDGGQPVVDARGNGSAIALNANGTTVDGFTAINASGDSQSGIKVNSNNNTVINNTALNNFIGIRLRSSSDNNLTNNNASNNSHGIYLGSSGITIHLTSAYDMYGEYASTNNLTGNTVSNKTNDILLDSSTSSNNNNLTGNIANANTYSGIYLYSASNNDLTGNTASHNYQGIYLDASSYNNLSENIANSNSKRGIRLHYSSNYNNITGNTLNANTEWGIVLGLSNNNTLANNTVSNSYFAMSLYSSSYNNLTNNTISNNSESIALRYYGNNTVTGNTLSNNKYGILLFSTSNNNLSGNTVSNFMSDFYGIYLDSSNINTLTGNTASKNRYGILLQYASNNTLTGNIANSNNDCGIYLSSSSNNNTLTGNTANSNKVYGIRLSSSSNNRIYNNYFDNTNNAWDNGKNFWNISRTPGKNIINGSWLGGNYWSDYAGEDTDIPSDGLGDTTTPYNSSGNIVNGGDWLPLVITEPDTTAPAAISDLATANPTSSTISLSWTAPGDDGTLGRAILYDIRYQIGAAINESNWANATQVTGAPAPKAANSSESFTVSGLAANTTYYFAIKTADEVPNISPISNSPNGTTSAPDTEPPVISNVTSTGITETTATITWDTDEPADSQVKYGTTPGGPYPNETYNNSTVMSHSVVLTGLTANTTIYFRVYSTDTSNNAAVSAEFNFTTATPETPCVRVSPATQVVAAGNSLQVNITVENVTHMAGNQAIMNFDPSALQATAIIEGAFLKSDNGTTLNITEINNTDGTAYFAFALFSTGNVSGSGVLATITFDTNASAEGTFSLNLTEVLLGNETGANIPAMVFNGTVELIPFFLVIVSPENRTYASTCVNLSYRVEPLGVALNWTQYSLDGGDYTNFTVNTSISGLSAGNHSVLMRGCDNQGVLAVSTTVNFTIHPGDINNDKAVNLFDLQRLAWAFMATPNDPNWNPAANLNCDNVVNIFDLQILAWNFMNHY